MSDAQSIERSAVIAAPIDAVWSLVRRFDDWGRWLAPIEDCTIEAEEPADKVGAVRVVRTSAGVSHEKLYGLSDKRHTVEYGVVKSTSLAIDHHLATVSLSPITDEEHTFVRWSARFEAAPSDAAAIADRMATVIIEGGLAGLQNLFVD
jgi:hypothetical protein